MATINHKKYDEATETFKDFNVYDGKETLIFKVDGEAGNVGIGTANPTYSLDIEKTTGEVAIQLQARDDSSNTAIYFGDNSDSDVGSLIYNQGSNYMSFTTNAGERMRITSAGLVGIGVVPNQGSELQVAGTIDAWASLNTLLRMRHDGTRGLIQGYTSGAASTIALNADGGNVGIGTASPEGKLHVLNGSAGSVTANGNADELIVENSSTGGLSILTPDASTGYIIFGSPADNEGAIIRYQPTGTLMTIGTEVANGQLAFRTAAGTERMRIDSSGNVGIGTSSPSGKLHVAGGDIFLGASYALKYNSTSYMTPENNVSGAEISTAGVFVVKTGSTPAERMRIDSSGNVGIGTTSPSMALELVKNSTVGLVGNVYYSSRFLQDKTNYKGVFLGYDTSGQTAVIGAESAGAASELAFYTYSGSAWAERVTVTSNGLTFNGDTAAANALDDYEEGTWTPVLSNGSTEVAISHTYATYTKIGRQVTVNARTVNGDLSSFSLGDNISFTGIPFAAGGDYYSTVYVRGATAGNLVRLIQSSNGSSRLSTDLLVSELVDDTTDYWFTITYFV